MRCNWWGKSLTLSATVLSTGQVARKSAARKFHIFVLLFTYALFLSSGFAENMAQWRVPEGGKVPFDSTPINALTFSADGSRLAVASADGIALYDTYTGEVLRLFPVLMDDLTALALSSDG
jgi:WD40 repeat protein